MTTGNTFGTREALNMAGFLRENTHFLGVTPEDLKVRVEDIIPLSKSVTTSSTLVRNSKKYIVPFNNQFYMYPLMLEAHPTSKDMFKMVHPIPDILREGMVVVDSEIYYVKLEDLRRGIVRKSRRLPIPTKRTITYKDFLDGLACTQTQDLPDSHYYSSAAVATRRASITARETSSGVNQAQSTSGTANSGSFATDPESELEAELREIAMAYEDQVGALLGNDDSQEEWIQAEDLQPGQSDASGPVEDLL